MQGIFGVIDIGSNSTRLMLIENGATIYKKINTTRLAGGLKDNVLSDEAIIRTASAVADFYDLALKDGAKKVYAFGTAALRLAKNNQVFVDKVRDLCGLTVDIISGEKEAYYGATGALNGGDGAVIDIGGASTEITVVKSGKIEYSKSLNIGAVVMFNTFNLDISGLYGFLDKKVKEYGDFPKERFIGIGGTATTVAAIMQELEPYDPTKTDGFTFDYNDALILRDKLFSLSLDDRLKLKGLHPGRAEVIPYGIAILCAIMKEYNIGTVTVSEKDNLEGYFNNITEKI